MDDVYLGQLDKDDVFSLIDKLNVVNKIPYINAWIIMHAKPNNFFNLNIN